MNKQWSKKMKQDKGISLAALLITIIVLIIVMAITYNYFTADDSTIKVAKDLQANVKGAISSTQEEINSVVSDVENDSKKDEDSPVINNIKLTSRMDSIRIEVDANDKGSGVYNYTYEVIEIEGNTPAGKKTTIYYDCTISNLKANTQYKVIVTVSDKAGNTSNKEQTIYTKTGKPNIVVDRVYAKKDESIHIQVSGGSATSYKYKLNNGAWKDCDQYGKATINANDTQDGIYEVKAVAVGKDGEYGEIVSDSVNIIIDKIAPTITVKSNKNIITLTASDEVSKISQYGLADTNKNKIQTNNVESTSNIKKDIQINEGEYLVWVQDNAGNIGYEKVAYITPEAEIVGKSEYTKLEEAISKASSGDTIKILKEIKRENPISIDDKTITLNLNNHSITNQVGDVIQTSGNVTITGGKIESTNGTAIKTTKGTLTLGNNSDSTVADQNTPEIIGNKYGVYVEDGAQFNYYDGKISGVSAITGTTQNIPSIEGTTIDSDITGEKISSKLVTKESYTIGSTVQITVNVTGISKGIKGIQGNLTYDRDVLKYVSCSSDKANWDITQYNDDEGIFIAEIGEGYEKDESKYIKDQSTDLVTFTFNMKENADLGSSEVTLTDVKGTDPSFTTIKGTGSAVGFNINEENYDYYNEIVKNKPNGYSVVVTQYDTKTQKETVQLRATDEIEAKVLQKNYSNVSLAIDGVKANSGERKTIIVLEKSDITASNTITIPADKKIKIRDNANKAVTLNANIVNNGTLEILSGTIQSSTGNTIENTGSLEVTGGKIVSNSGIAINGTSGTLIIGNDDGKVNSTSPSISGKTYGIYASEFDFYDGVIRGNKAYSGKIVGKPTGYKAWLVVSSGGEELSLSKLN